MPSNMKFSKDDHIEEIIVHQKLNSIYYDCKSDPVIFEKKLHDLRKRGEQLGITTTDSILCNRISAHLRGPFEILTLKYELYYTTMTLTDLLNDIKSVYQRKILVPKILGESNQWSMPTDFRARKPVRDTDRPYDRSKGKMKRERQY
ncbi:hypothetical protein DAKH74_011980 [Maudiozyma humilis]|uniref:Uncharacterized protein n=1 Tax=Maudiozyma humilis TaxID=51915 RepID=A0AAV5RTZ2_MAUHU|nr:hypothetical protein DAKH74_011980 [Kazachstania humilis]